MTGRTKQWDILTDAEVDILTSLADGMTIVAIAAERHVSAETVKAQVKSFRLKLDARTTVHAVALAYHTGLLVPLKAAA